jgi:hypothetical protein
MIYDHMLLEVYRMYLLDNKAFLYTRAHCVSHSAQCESHHGARASKDRLSVEYIRYFCANSAFSEPCGVSTHLLAGLSNILLLFSISLTFLVYQPGERMH